MLEAPCATDSLIVGIVSVLEAAALKSDKFLLLVQGTAEEVARAKDVLQTETEATQTDLHSSEAVAPAPVAA